MLVLYTSKQNKTCTLFTFLLLVILRVSYYYVYFKDFLKNDFKVTHFVSGDI